MNLVSMSDLHLGSRHSKCRQFRAFLQSLPPDTALVLNGDMVDAERRNTTAEQLAVIAAICAESFHRRIVWTGGNHDRGFVPAEPNKIEFVNSWSDGTTYFAHGDRFMPAHLLYLLFGRVMRVYRSCRPPDSMVSLRLAQRIPMLLRLLKAGSMAKAVRFAERHGYRTVVCGHLHVVMDKTVRGVRYINTGTWTGWPAFYLSCRENEMRLIKVEGEEFGPDESSSPR